MSTENHDLYRPASAATAAIEAMIAQHWSTTPVPEGVHANFSARIGLGQLDPDACTPTLFHP